MKLTLTPVQSRVFAIVLLPVIIGMLIARR
jgi:hypothetical protein